MVSMDVIGTHAARLPALDDRWTPREYAREELVEGRVSYASGPLEIGFQARYLRDVTDQIGEKVEFHFSDGSAPTVVRDAGDGSALYVLMPMRV